MVGTFNVVCSRKTEGCGKALITIIYCDSIGVCFGSLRRGFLSEISLDFHVQSYIYQLIHKGVHRKGGGGQMYRCIET